MVSVLLVVGIGVAVFVGFNIGGSSTGVAFGPAVGSGTVSKTGAAALMTGFALLGGATVGTNVIRTMGGDIVPQNQFTLAASVAVLFFVGLALLISNLFGVPASTSMTAVGAIAGLGVATGTIDWSVMGEIVTWWLVAPVVAFWLCAVIGRYFYPHLEARFALETPGEGTSRRERVGGVLVVVIGCYMAFSAGASNVANAVAPLVGSGQLDLYPGVALAGGAMGLGAFTIARRTLDTVGNDLTDLPILAALIVEVVSASIITGLSQIGIPASLAVSATMCIVGLGWGRATRTIRLADAAEAAVAGPPAAEESDVTVDALAEEESATAAAAAGETTSPSVNVDVTVDGTAGSPADTSSGPAAEPAAEAAAQAAEAAAEAAQAADVASEAELEAAEAAEAAAEAEKEADPASAAEAAAQAAEAAETAAKAASDSAAAAETGLEGASTAPPAPEDVPKIGEEDPQQMTAADLFDPRATGRVVMLWILTPSVSAVGSYLVFRLLPIP